MRFYRWLLRLYPEGFRAEYGEELCRVHAERAALTTGPAAPLRNALAAVADVLPNAIAVHIDILRQDLRVAVRSLRRTPGFALTAILVVALGVGANTAVFSLADFVLVRPLPFRDPGRIVKLWQSTPAYSRNECSPANMRDWGTLSSSFSGLAATTTRPRTWSAWASLARCSSRSRRRSCSASSACARYAAGCSPPTPWTRRRSC
jgi:putative ABC transport system permease protein